MNKMRLQIALLLAALTAVSCDSWSWNKDKSSGDASSGNPVVAPTPVPATGEGQKNEGPADREGRHLEVTDDLYVDPESKQELAGNDTEPRHFVRDKLCGLGLMACDEEEEYQDGTNPEPKRNIRPADIIYAQPVRLKPVGGPIAAVPIKGGPPSAGGYGGHPDSFGPPSGYGPPRPVPFPSGSSSSFSGRPYVSGSRPPPGPISYGGPRPRPPLTPPTGPYIEGSEFHEIGKKPSLQVTAQHGVQQHVHHHFHHNADKTPAGVVEQSIEPSSLTYGGQSLGTYGSNYDNYAVSQGPFYKKELNLNKPYVGNSLQTASGNNYADRYPAYETPRGEDDCYCVPWDQCLPHEVLRKEDGYAIDPRTVNKPDIQAIGLDDVVITDGNGTIISHHKREESSEESDKTRSRRQTEEREGPLDSVDLDSKAASDEQISQRSVGGKVEDLKSNGYKVQGPKMAPNLRRQAYYGGPNKCGRAQVCCRRPLRKQSYRPKPVGYAQCGRRNAQGINGRIKNPVFVDGDSEFGEYPWQVAILKKDPQESVYVCGGTLIDQLHIITAAHCVKSYTEYDLRVRLGEWDVNHDVEFYPYVERDVVGLVVHPEFYAGTLYNDIAVLRLDKPVDFTQSPHISPACLPDQYSDYAGTRCWTTGWGKDAFGEQGKYQNILKEVDVPVVGFQQCQSQLQQTRLGYDFKLHPGFVCAGGEEGKDACKGDGGGPMVCERGGTWQVVGIVSWGVGCGKYGVPGVYTKVAYYLDWIRQVTQRI
ncbi:uncharacterized protein [Bemisia tabaci]